MAGQELAMDFFLPISKEHISVTGEIVWAGAQGVGLKFKSIGPEESRKLDFYHSNGGIPEFLSIEKRARKAGKIRKKRIRWQPSTSPGVSGYRLYWSERGEVKYDSDHAQLGNVTEVTLPDDVPSFPLIAGEIKLGVTATSEAGNESDMTTLTAFFNFTVPEAPKNIKIEEV
jgi:hypothetical protein